VGEGFVHIIWSVDRLWRTLCHSFVVQGPKKIKHITIYTFAQVTVMMTMMMIKMTIMMRMAMMMMVMMTMM
jgi:hypothetical protein